ncbi:MAG: hypothetical protein ABW321_03725 [Polyangiales bacterium]
MAKTSKKSSKPKAGRVNKSAWIRSQTSSLSAKEVVEKAKGEGITLSLAQVYTARSTAKRQGEPARGSGSISGIGKRGPGRPKRAGAAGGAVGGLSASHDLQRQFIAIAVRIGTDEAQRLLERVAQGQAR